LSVPASCLALSQDNPLQAKVEHGRILRIGPQEENNIPRLESHPEKHSVVAWTWCPRDPLLYATNLTGRFQFGRSQRLFIVAPCIQMEFHDKELSPNEEAHFSDTGDVYAAVSSNHA
jgi:hypothetical protein